MTTWLDDFTTDHFADSRYNVIVASGPVPSPSGGVLIEPHGDYVLWLDTVASSLGDVSEASMEVTQMTDGALLLIGFIDSTLNIGYYGELNQGNFLAAVASDGGADPTVSGSVSEARFDPPFTMTVKLTRSAGTLDVTIGLITYTLSVTPPALCAGMAAATVYGFAEIQNNTLGPGDFTAVQWAYNSGGATGGGGPPDYGGGTYPGSGGGGPVGPPYGGGPSPGIKPIQVGSLLSGLVKR